MLILFLVSFLGTAFGYPEERSKAFTYTSNEVLEGSLLMSKHASLRALEYQNVQDAREKEAINSELGKMEDEKNHLVLLEAAVAEPAFFASCRRFLRAGVAIP